MAGRAAPPQPQANNNGQPATFVIPVGPVALSQAIRGQNRKRSAEDDILFSGKRSNQNNNSTSNITSKNPVSRRSSLYSALFDPELKDLVTNILQSGDMKSEINSFLIDFVGKVGIGMDEVFENSYTQTSFAIKLAKLKKFFKENRQPPGEQYPPDFRNTFQNLFPNENDTITGHIHDPPDYCNLILSSSNNGDVFFDMNGKQVNMEEDDEIERELTRLADFNDEPTFDEVESFAQAGLSTAAFAASSMVTDSIQSNLQNNNAESDRFAQLFQQQMQHIQEASQFQLSNETYTQNYLTNIRIKDGVKTFMRFINTYNNPAGGAAGAQPNVYVAGVERFLQGAQYFAPMILPLASAVGVPPGVTTVLQAGGFMATSFLDRVAPSTHGIANITNVTYNETTGRPEKTVVTKGVDLFDHMLAEQNSRLKRDEFDYNRLKDRNQSSSQLLEASMQRERELFQQRFQNIQEGRKIANELFGNYSRATSSYFSALKDYKNQLKVWKEKQANQERTKVVNDLLAHLKSKRVKALINARIVKRSYVKINGVDVNLSRADYFANYASGYYRYNEVGNYKYAFMEFIQQRNIKHKLYSNLSYQDVSTEDINLFNLFVDRLSFYRDYIESYELHLYDFMKSHRKSVDNEIKSLINKEVTDKINEANLTKIADTDFLNKTVEQLMEYFSKEMNDVAFLTRELSSINVYRKIYTQMEANFNVFVELHIPTDWLIMNYKEDWLRLRPLVFILRDRLKYVQINWNDLELIVNPMIYSTIRSVFNEINLDLKQYNKRQFENFEEILAEDKWRFLFLNLCVVLFRNDRRTNSNKWDPNAVESRRMDLAMITVRTQIINFIKNN